MSKKFYVTTPIYYVNAQPHLGSLYSTVLADVAARWHALHGEKTFLLTGTDEHGQKIAQAAAAVQQAPKDFVDSFIASFKRVWDLYEINYQYFVRTTDQAHVNAVQAWIIALQKKGDIYKSKYQGYYCTPCETFVTEKDFQELSSIPTCPTCGRITHYLEEESYFFKLSAYQEKLLDFYKNNPDFITPTERIHEVISFVKSGLKDLSISRTTISWGIPFPGDDRHVCYVWADALNNYLSAIGYGNPERKKEFDFWWPADLQVLGKDIVRFHAVYWPAFLMAVDLPMPKKLLVHGWIKIGEQKMSKSLGNVVDPIKLYDTYGADVIRYYLVRHLAITQDAPFTIEDLEHRINADLADDLGNLLNRMMVLAHAQQCTTISSGQVWLSDEIELQKLFEDIVRDVQADMKNYFFHRAYAHVWKFIKAVNGYFHGQEPWKVVKSDRAAFERIIAATAQSLYLISRILWPVMPKKMNDLSSALGVEQVVLGQDHLSELCSYKWDRTFILQQRTPLFPKIVPATTDASSVKQEKVMNNIQAHVITIDEFTKIELLVGTITHVALVPKSDKLYALTVDLGVHGIRQVCSGVRQHFAPEDLLHKQGVFVANLQPRTMMGLTSQGMMLFAENPQGKLEMVTVAGAVAPGTRLR